MAVIFIRKYLIMTDNFWKLISCKSKKRKMKEISLEKNISTQQQTAQK